MNTGGTPTAPPCLVLSISNPSLDGGYPVRWMSCVVERDWATAKERLVENSTKCWRLSF